VHNMLVACEIVWLDLLIASEERGLHSIPDFSPYWLIKLHYNLLYFHSKNFVQNIFALSMNCKIDCSIRVFRYFS